MTVYVLIEEYEREGFTLVGAYATVELAQDVYPGEWSLSRDGNYYQSVDWGTRRVIYPAKVMAGTQV